jgi:hypothetical protein
MSETYYRTSVVGEVLATIGFWCGISLLFTSMSIMTFVGLVKIGVL